MKLPKMPAVIYSALGPVRVTFFKAKRAKKRKVCGMYFYTKRRIVLAPRMDARVTWATLWHEVVHVALLDAGVTGNVLSKDQEEVVCDAVALQLTGMMLHGSLKVLSHWEQGGR